MRLPAPAVAASSAPEAQVADAEAVAEGGEEEKEEERRRNLYVANLPWTLPAVEIEKLFAECGVVKDVQVKDEDVTTNHYNPIASLMRCCIFLRVF